MNTKNEAYIWTGIAEIAPRDGNSLLGGASAAYVAIAALAESEDDFREMAVSVMGAMDFELVAVDEVGRVHDLVTFSSDDPEFLQKIKNLNKDNKFVWGIFHCYRNS